MSQDVSQFVATVRRIPLFAGLNPTQAVSILKVCDRTSVEAGNVVCRSGDRSDSMFILLTGVLSVRLEDGTQVAKIEPVAPVGEMGLFTEEPRSATVVAAEACSLFELGKYKLQGAMRQNKEIEINISRNLISILSQRLRDANSELSFLRGVVADQGTGEVEVPDTEESPLPPDTL